MHAHRRARSAALPDVHVPIVVGGPLTPAHQQVRLRSRSKPVSLPGRLEAPPRRVGRDVHAAARHLRLPVGAREDNVSSRPGTPERLRKLPDIWTEHPEIVRDLLREAGFSCGVEPRILKGRDPDWTCIIDGQRIGGDIYIHQADTILGVSMGAVVFALFGAQIAVLLVVLWQTSVIIILKRKPRGS